MTSKIRTFRDLIAWQRAMALAVAAYRESASMPSDERFGLTAQLRRSAVSVPSNIAQGYGRGTRRDYLKFLRTARGSIAELDTQVELAVALELLRRPDDLIRLLQETDRVLQGLIRSLEELDRSESEAPP